MYPRAVTSASARRSALLLLAGTSALVAIACNTSVNLPFGPVSTSPTVTPTPAAVPVDYGNGHEGPLILATTTTMFPTQCVGLTLGQMSSLTLAATPVPAWTTSDRVLVLQFRDVFALSGVQTPVDPADTRAGHWEVGRIASAGALNALLTAPLSRKYETKANGAIGAQACLVHQYSWISIGSTANLKATTFNGVSGGVVALYASSSLTVGPLTGGGGGINADGVGALPGLSAKGTGPNAATYDLAVGMAGGKGDGLDGLSNSKAGRGNLATGAGGGNALSSGGGGGGSGGQGGDGGRFATDGVQTGGLGGAPVASSLLLTFGGAGGGGYGPLGSAPSSGGAGGGIVVLIARHLFGTGEITARGGQSGSAGTNGGGGGSGAGGTILLVSSNGGFHGAINVRTYPGGNANGTSGAGGGGAGGRIIASDVQFGLAAQVLTSGDVAGTSSGSLPGQDGAGGQQIHADVNPNQAH